MLKIDIIGDIHGCIDEFKELTIKMGYDWTSGIPVHPENRVLGFVGDLTDRGKNSLEVVRIVYELWKNGLAHYVPGNHCNKLYRYLSGNKVMIAHGLETTVEELDRLAPAERSKITDAFKILYEESPLYSLLDEGNLILAHAGIRGDYIGKMNEKVKTFVLYGDITGERNPDGSPVRRDWARHYNGSSLIVYGHTPVQDARFINRTVNIDTGAVFGGKLTALRYPEMEIVDVPSSMPLVPEKFRIFD